MSLLHRLRQFLNDLVAPFGIGIARVSRRPWSWRRGTGMAQVGRFKIEIPQHNPLGMVYDENPQFAGQLGRLTSIVKKKYPNASAIDVGANVGDTACIIKSAEDIPVMCIEGDAATFVYLQRNIAQFRDASAHNLFLGENTAEVHANLENRGWNLTIIPNAAAASSRIKIVRLDDYIAAQPAVHTCKLLKIDTEGFDCSIVRGATRLLEEVAPVITFEYNRGNMDKIGEPGLPTLELLEQLGYSTIVFHDQDGRLLLATTLGEHALIKDVHEYADCVHGRVGYLDITTFHERDTDLASEFIAEERLIRVRE